ncbi:hypothetical protein QBC47DRAFT_385585 [Echria macrotheca]|uniref:Secreted protein n=1 Tax=Echria macrotheca TaxID=438768 RepID=A0AAJ0BBN0_9PEZI|nr:hypothetical protein QBC47DRAFT_385585 [Echria macrotheca]
MLSACILILSFVYAPLSTSSSSTFAVSLLSFALLPCRYTPPWRPGAPLSPVILVVGYFPAVGRRQRGWNPPGGILALARCGRHSEVK